MGKVTVRADGTANVNAATAADVCDESGAVVGYYLPREEFERMRYGWLPAHSPEKVEEAVRRVRAGGGRTTEQVVAAIDAAKLRWEKWKRTGEAS